MACTSRSLKAYEAFTLVELSIVLVILGLLVGGVLAGRSLIESATLRNQIAQIDQYNTAQRAFLDKYFDPPGDLALATAQSLNFQTTGCNGTSAGQRDGNGIVQEGIYEYFVAWKENQLFWQDLSQAGLIGGTYPGDGAVSSGCGAAPTMNLTAGSTHIRNFLPEAAIGGGNFVYALYANPQIMDTANNANTVRGGNNYFTISAVTGQTTSCSASNPGLTVLQSYQLDTKMDDGYANKGSVIAQYTSCTSQYPTNSGTTDNASTCFNQTTGLYSIMIDGGSNKRCGLSFRWR